MDNKRENEILLYLSRKNDYSTAEELSNEFNISNKTVYRLIKKCNKDLEIIQSQKGKGYKLNYENYIKHIGADHKVSEFNPIKRRKKVIEELLLCSPSSINVHALYDKYYVSDTVIFNDEKIISEILKQYNLEYVRKSKQISIIGSEMDIRKAISNIVFEGEPIDHNLLQSAEGIGVDNDDMQFVLSQILFIEQKINTNLSYPYDVNIFIHLYVMIGRIRNSSELSKRYHDFPKAIDNQIYKDNNDVYEIAKEVIDNMQENIKKEIPKEEVYYLFQYLLSSRIDSSDESEGLNLSIVSEITQIYIQRVEEDLSLNKNESIYSELYQHIKPMVNRLKNNISIKNKLIDSIKVEYPELYNEVAIISNSISEEFDLPKISDDENGFITLYFAKMLEQDVRSIRVLISCSTGFGTSELLKVKVNKNFPNIDVVDVVSLRELSAKLEKNADIDLIITTIDLPENIEIPYIVISAILSKVDQQRIEDAIQKV